MESSYWQPDQSYQCFCNPKLLPAIAPQLHELAIQPSLSPA
jgi:hypothetical protein